LWGAIAATGLLMPQWWYGPILATVVVFVVGIGLRFALAARARSQAVRLGQPLFRALAEVERLRTSGTQAGEEAYKRAINLSLQHQRDEVRQAEIAHRRGLAESLQRRDEAVTRAENEWQIRSTGTESCRDVELNAIETKCRDRVESIEAQAKSELDA